MDKQYFQISIPIIDNSKLTDNSDTVSSTMFAKHWGQVDTEYIETSEGSAQIKFDVSRLQHERPLQIRLFFEEEQEERFQIVTTEDVIVFDLGRLPLTPKYTGYLVLSNDGMGLYGGAVVFRKDRYNYNETRLLSQYPVKYSEVSMDENKLTISVDFVDKCPEKLQCFWMTTGQKLFPPAITESQERYSFTFEHTPQVPKGLWKGGIVDENRKFIAQVSFWVL